MYCGPNTKSISGKRRSKASPANVDSNVDECSVINFEMQIASYSHNINTRNSKLTFLLSDASSHDNSQGLPLPFQGGIWPQCIVDFLFGMIANGACVEQ
jgi:hypothetical protein